MGTSTPYGGPGSGTPIIPTWLEPDSGDVPASQDMPNPTAAAEPTPALPHSGDVPEAPGERPAPQPATGGRFVGARNNFTRFATSGGSNRRSLGRAVSSYIATSAGGARAAAHRMGASRTTGAGLLGFLADARTHGTHEALHSLDLDHLAGKPIEAVFLGLADCVCPNEGTIDAGIARSAFIEMVAELPSIGITDLDALTVEQMSTVFEMFATNAIEARLCNDIAMNLVTAPRDVRSAQEVQNQLHDFIRRGVSDAMAANQAALQILAKERILAFVEGVYEEAFSILEALGEREGGDV